MSISLKLPTERSAVAHGRILQLDGLRAVAIMLVLVAHTMHIPLTWVGFDIFFVLSGFLITGILLARKASGAGYFSYFYRRRIFRIIPAYALALLAFGLLFGWTTFHPWPLLAFFGMNMQHLWSPHPNPLPLWSLAVEEQFYLFWPVIILLVSEAGLLRIAIGALVAAPLLRVVCTPMFPGSLQIYMLTPFRCDLLCAGAIITLLWKQRSPRLEHNCREYAWIGVVAGFGLLAFLQYWPMFRIASNTRWSNGLDYSLSVIGSASLLLWTLADRSWWYRLLTFRPIRYIGEISYTMYLVHLIVVFLIWHTIPTGLTMFAIVTCGSILWASVSWFLVERPLIRFGARTGAVDSAKS